MSCDTAPYAPTEHCLVDDLIGIMTQGLELINTLTPHDYTSSHAQIKTSSIGAHYRHHLEHVQMLLDGAHDLIDYDRRKRDLAIETDLQVARARTQDLIERLGHFTPEQLSAAVTVVHQSCEDDAQRPVCHSTFEREVLFVLSHAVHHYALINIIHQLVTQRPCQPGFGVMPSTLSYARTCGQT